MKSNKNKTIDLSVEEGKEYLDKCISVNKPVKMDEVIDSIILGDSLSVMKCLPRNSVDVLIVDPPYNLTKNYNGYQFRRTDVQHYAQFTISWLLAVLPLLKDTASIYVCSDWISSMVIGNVLSRHTNIRNRITWQREKGRGAQSNWKNGMEDIWFATISNEYTFNLDAVKTRKQVLAPYKVDGQPKDWKDTPDGKFRDTCPSNFWDDITIPYWSMPENTAHPTQKPEKLLAKLILASSNEGDIILDPFSGSGSTAVTAYKLNRHFIGIEQDPQYCVWAQKRLEMALTDKNIQGFADGVFWDRNTNIKRYYHLDNQD